MSTNRHDNGYREPGWLWVGTILLLVSLVFVAVWAGYNAGWSR